MDWFSVIFGAIAGGALLIGVGMITVTAGKAECSRWNHGAVCELVWMPKGEMK